MDFMDALVDGFVEAQVKLENLEESKMKTKEEIALDELKQLIHTAWVWEYPEGKCRVIDGYVQCLSTMTGKKYGWNDKTIFILGDDGKRIWVEYVE